LNCAKNHNLCDGATKNLAFPRLRHRNLLRTIKLQHGRATNHELSNPWASNLHGGSVPRPRKPWVWAVIGEKVSELLTSVSGNAGGQCLDAGGAGGAVGAGGVLSSIISSFRSKWKVNNSKAGQKKATRSTVVICW